MPINCEAKIHDENGKELIGKASITYLGALISNDGKIQSELNRRLGMAAQVSIALKNVWNHTEWSKKDKEYIFNAMISSKLLYSLQCSWLNKSQRQQLDGFQIRILRQIAGIAPSFYSRVSNQTVLEKFNCKRMTQRLLEQQLVLYGKVAKSADSIMNKITFEEGSASPNEFQRKQGRPKLNWSAEVGKHAKKVNGNPIELSADAWKANVKKYCKQSGTTQTSTTQTSELWLAVAYR